MTEQALPEATEQDLAERPPPSRAELKEKLALEAARVAEAEERRRQVLGLIRGSKLRVGVLEGETQGQGLEALLANLGIAVADFALMHVLNGNVEIKTAKEALDVATLAYKLHQSAAGASETDLAALTPEQRAERRKVMIAGALQLKATLLERADEAVVRGDGSLTEAELDAVPRRASTDTKAPGSTIQPLRPPVRAQEA